MGRITAAACLLPAMSLLGCASTGPPLAGYEGPGRR